MTGILRDTANRIMAGITVIAIAAAIIAGVIAGNAVDTARKREQDVLSAQTVRKAGLPADAAASAGKFLVSTFDELNKKIPSGFFDDGSENLQKMINGDLSFFPSSVADDIVFTDDAKSTSSDRSISYTDMRTGAYSGMIMGAQAYANAKKARSTLTTDTGMISVDKATGTAYIPSEAVLGAPVDLIYELKWDDGTWKIDGDSLGGHIYMQLRSAQFQTAAMNQNGDQGDSSSSK